jgi:YVTN family beta-propeller protein
MAAPSSRRLLACLVALGQGVAGAALRADDDGPVLPDGPVGRREGAIVTPVNQVLMPTGLQVELPGLRPQAVALAPDGSILVTSGKTSEIVVIDPDDGAILDRVGLPAADVNAPAPADQPDRNLAPDAKAIQSFTGLRFAPDGRRLYMSDVQGGVKVFTVAAGKVRPSHTIPLPPAGAPARPAEIPSGLALSGDGARLYVCGNLSNRLLEIDTASGKVLRTFDAGVAPFDVVLAGGKAFVSNWGGRRPAPGDTTGPAGKGTLVRVDPTTFIASEGSVTVVDLDSGAGSEVLAGRHASALAASPDGRHVVCANAGDDTLSILDAASAKVVAIAGTKRTPAELFGAQPGALAFSADGTRLYVCNAAQNAVAVLAWRADADDPSEPPETRLEGLIPVGWYPSGIAVDRARGALAVSNMKGLPQGPRVAEGREGYNSHHYHGSLSLVPLPDGAALATLSDRADRLLRAPAIREALLPPRDGVAPRAIPERIGEPSLIEHVVYVIKENRTFDQVLGDMPGGNGHAELCIFGENLTPNQHAIARRWVLLDNTYCCGILSADGHNWSTSAVATDYVERSFAGFPRSYPDGMEDTDADALAWSPAGFIWDRARERGRSIRNYGEFMMPRVRWRDPTRPGRPDFAACHAAFLAGAGQTDVIFASEPAIESIRAFSPTDTVGWDMNVPDQFRADFVIRELADFEARGEYPNLVIICLPNDHTSGTSPGFPTPEASIADNDLAFGRILEALSQSSFWPKMAVFAIEDDPQAGWDHVSGYRTTCYVAGPHVRRGAVVGTRYNTTSVLRTIGQILGLDPLNQFDASATPMFDCFTDDADPAPFLALPATVPLDRMNGRPHTLLDPVQRGDAEASAAMNFSEVDRAPEDALNRILWRHVRGGVPYPEWAVTGEGEEDDDAERTGDD